MSTYSCRITASFVRLVIFHTWISFHAKLSYNLKIEYAVLPPGCILAAIPEEGTTIAILECSRILASNGLMRNLLPVLPCASRKKSSSSFYCTSSKMKKMRASITQKYLIRSHTIIRNIIRNPKSYVFSKS